MKTRRLLTGVLTAGLIAGATTGAALGKTKITYLYNWYNEGIVSDAYKAIIDGFNKSRTDIEVDGIQGGGYDKLTSMIAGGVAPDVVQFERSAVIEWLLQDRLMPVRADAGLFRTRYAKSALAEVDWFGQIWGVPWDIDIRGLFWNVDMLERAGIDSARPPTSFAELDRNAQKLTRQMTDGGYQEIGFVPWINNWYPPGWFWAFGGDVYDYKAMQPVVDRPQNVEAFEWVLSYVRRYGYAPASQAGSLANFIAGKVGMIAEETGLLNRIKASPVGEALRVRAGAVPHMPGGRNGTWAGGTGHIIPVGARHYREALIFLDYLGSPAAQFTWYRLTGRLPTHVMALQQAYESAPAALQKVIEQWHVANPRPPMWVYILVDVQGGLLPARNQVLQQAKTPEEALNVVQRLALQEARYQKLKERSAGT